MVRETHIRATHSEVPCDSEPWPGLAECSIPVRDFLSEFLVCPYISIHSLGWVPRFANNPVWLGDALQGLVEMSNILDMSHKGLPETGSLTNIQQVADNEPRVYLAWKALHKSTTQCKVLSLLLMGPCPCTTAPRLSCHAGMNDLLGPTSDMMGWPASYYTLTTKGGSNTLLCAQWEAPMGLSLVLRWTRTLLHVWDRGVHLDSC